ncbi:MAG: cytochrome c biogenesis CcdA family protein [Anaerolineae bacterium]
MQIPEVTVGLAFLAGLLSFLSPCVLPLVPIYIGYLSGATAQQEAGARWRTAGHAGAFVAGFSVVFVALGSIAGLAGSLLAAPVAPLGFLGRALVVLNQATVWLTRLGGLLLIVLGLHLTGLVRIPLLYRELRIEGARPSRRGLFASVLVGMIFAAGWTPCVGPYLTAILMLAGSSGTVARGAFLLAVYSLGLGLPFLLAGVALQAVSASLRRFGRFMRVTSIVGGALLMLMGVLLLTGHLMWLNMLLGGLWEAPLS